MLESEQKSSAFFSTGKSSPLKLISPSDSDAITSVTEIQENNSKMNIYV